jgi:hypothetical protein
MPRDALVPVQQASTRTIADYGHADFRGKPFAGLLEG